MKNLYHPYKAILFDLDDTLLNFKRSETQSLQILYDNFYKNHVNQELFTERYHEVNESLWTRLEDGTISFDYIKEKQFEIISGKLSLEMDSAKVCQFFHDTIQSLHYWLEGAHETVNSLKDTHKIGIVTNGFTNVQKAKYKELSFETWCEVFIVAHEVNVAKPNKKIFEIALEKLEISKEHVLMVGDSLSSDYQGSLNAGIDFCWFNQHNTPLPAHLPQPKFTISSIKELLKISAGKKP